MLIEELFTTPIFSFQSKTLEQQNAVLAQKLRQLREEEPKGRMVSNIGGWQSGESLFLDPRFTELGLAILTMAYEVGAALGWNLQDNHIEIDTSWANINRRGSANHDHMHPGAFLSGVYYIATPPNCGNIVFRDPRETTHYMTTWHINREVRVNHRFFVFPATAGTAYIFPAWLVHRVETSEADEERMSVAFNIQCCPGAPGAAR